MNQPPQLTEERPAWLPTEHELSSPAPGRRAVIEYGAEDPCAEAMAAWIAEADAAAAELAEELAARW